VSQLINALVLRLVSGKEKMPSSTVTVAPLKMLGPEGDGANDISGCGVVPIEFL